MDISSIFLFLGGLGLFLYGMNVMSDGLELAAGDKLRVVLEKTTKNRFLGVLVGTGVTALIQSSSATTVMLVGFVNAGLMTLMQATGVIMGANIGTTITGQIIAFKIDAIAPFILFAGVIMYMFVKNRTAKNISMIIMGFGILFVGMTLMGDGVAPLEDDPAFQQFLISFDNPFLSVLVGTAFTAIMQSSSASLGVLAAFGFAGIINLDTAVYIILGMNIGTCITAVIASLAANRDSKRTALIHVLFNIFGVIIVGILIAIFPQLVDMVESWSPGDVARQIANFHTMFNIVSTVLLFPFAGGLVFLVKKLIPEHESERQAMPERRLMYLDKNITLTPAIAVSQAHREICRMGHIAVDNYKTAIRGFFKNDLNRARGVLEVEKTINYLNHEITGCLIHMRGLELSQKDVERLGMMISVVDDIERIGDHAENIAEYTMIIDEHKIPFSDTGLESLTTLAYASVDTIELALSTYENLDFSTIDKVSELEEKVDELKDVATEEHIVRLMENKCNPRAAIIFTDMVTDLERGSDHATNIAYSLRGEPSLWDDVHYTDKQAEIPAN